MFSYVVCCAFSDEAVRDRWLAWLAEEHCADVCRAGALSAELVALDPQGGADFEIEIHYVFASRQSFEVYERDEAPRLRAEGLRFKGTDDVRFSRKTGEIILQTRPM